MSSPIIIHGKPIAGGKLPLVCVPLTGTTRDAILAELATVVPQKPDVIEWRADFFEAVRTAQSVIATATAIRQQVGEIPVIFTLRCAGEGGYPVPASESEVVELYCRVCASRTVDLVDYELSHPEESQRHLRHASSQNDVGMIGSYHDFQCTPSVDVILEKFLTAERLGADVAKVAVMPRSLEDVLSLLAATLRARREMRIPLVSLSMGAYGSLTRMFGFAFGSALTFAVGQSSSAPGQMPIEDLRTVLNILEKSLGDLQF